MVLFARSSVVAALLTLAGCQTDEAYTLKYDCPYTIGATVGADDAADLGFSATDALAAASVATSGTTEPTPDVPDAYPVALTHAFAVIGDVTVIDFGTPADLRCPAGPALRIDASYDLAGTIGVWAVSATDHAPMVATAAALDAISTAPSDDRVFWNAAVEPGLQDLARTTVPGFVPTDCELSFSLGPLPDELLAGSWSRELTSGELDVDCANSAGTFLTWTGTVLDDASTSPTN